MSNIFSDKNKEFLEEDVTEMLNTEEGEKEDTIDPNEIVQGGIYCSFISCNTT